MAGPEVKISYVDRPEVSETYADSINKIAFDGQAWRIEFGITRTGEPIPPNTLPGNRYPCCRLVLPPNAGLELAAQLKQIMDVMEKQGMLKKQPIANITPGSKPN